MSDVVRNVFLPTEEVNNKSYIKSMDQYRKMHKESIDNPAAFWKESIRSLQWQREITDHGDPLKYNFDRRNGPIFIKFMEDAYTNACYNLLDVHLKNGHGDRVAIHWEGNHPNDHSTLTYKQLHREVCKFANVLKSHEIKPGDRVVIYLPMIVEAMIAMLACSRLGAVHTVVFAGFSSAALCERIVDCLPQFLITADGAWRGTKQLHLKKIADEAMNRALVDHNVVVRVCVVVLHLPRVTSAGEIDDDVTLYMMPERDVFWHDLMKTSSDVCDPVWVNSEDPLFMLYTSGSTGKPKGVVHTTGGYLVYAAMTFKFVFDYTKDDVYFCTADIGWITGHTYCVYGPLMNAATIIMFEGTPFYPDNDRYWEIIEKYKVNQFYTAPTALRALMKFGDGNVTKHNLQSLRILGSVGEPINPEAWHWYYKVVGNSKCSIVDTFWQTETGGHVLTPLPGATPMKAGSAVQPFFGVDAHILNDEGAPIEGEGEGYLVFSKPWPGMMRTLYNNHQRYEETYFTQFPGYYCTGDGARRDADGYLWVTGRIDDMLNVSGHLMSTAEVEGVLTEHPDVTEAAVVAKPHAIKGQALYCFISINEDAEFNKELMNELKKKVREKIGPFAMPDTLQYAPGLPKTRSGKIMRRILRKIAINDRNVGDTSTLADEGIVDQLFANRPADKK